MRVHNCYQFLKTQQTVYEWILWHIKQVWRITRQLFRENQNHHLPLCVEYSASFTFIVVWINILHHWKLKLVCVSVEKKNQKSNCLWTQSRGMFCFSSGFFLLFFVNISCPSRISLTSFLGHQRKLPQKIKSMSFMTFSYKWGHIKWLLLPFLWKCHQNKNTYSETIFSSHFIWFPWH